MCHPELVSGSHLFMLDTKFVSIHFGEPIPSSPRDTKIGIFALFHYFVYPSSLIVLQGQVT